MENFDWTKNDNNAMLARINAIGIETTAKEIQEQIYLKKENFEFCIEAAKNMKKMLEIFCQEEN